MSEMTPPFVPQLGGDDDDAYFSRNFVTSGDNDPLGDDSSDDSDSESFKKIQGVNVDHLISLAKRPSIKGSTGAASAASGDSTPHTSTPPSVQRPLKSGGQGSRLASRADLAKQSAGGEKPLRARSQHVSSANFD